MAKLIYTAIISLDGYVADQDGNFDWAAPDEEVHRFVNDLGAGKRSLIEGLHVGLELLDENRFGSGVVHLHYRNKSS